MAWSWGRRAARVAARLVARRDVLLAAVCAIALSGCDQNAQNVSVAQPRGATVAFESIDGPPAGQFHKLVQDLNDEAQARRLAVISRESPSAYRVRGYLAANVDQGGTTISWVWDVFDNDERRALRISGEETAKDRHHKSWNAADDAMLHRIARSSMDQLAAFLTSPEVAPGTPVPPAGAQLALVGLDNFSPEAAGIFRIFHPHADPVANRTAEAPPAADANADSIPLPRRRPPPAAAVSARETLTLSAATR
jgi:hypothetical protein